MDEERFIVEDLDPPTISQIVSELHSVAKWQKPKCINIFPAYILVLESGKAQIKKDLADFQIAVALFCSNS